jgi:hypothetical protein
MIIALLIMSIVLLIVSSSLLIATLGLREVIKEEMVDLAREFYSHEEQFYMAHRMIEEMGESYNKLQKQYEYMGAQVGEAFNQVHGHINQLARDSKALN